METEATEVAAEMPPPSAGRTNVVMPKDPTTVYFTNTLFGTAPVPPHSPFPSLPAPADKPSGNLSAQYDNPHFFALPFTLSMTPHPPLNLINQHFGWATPKTMAWDPHTAILRGDPFHMRCEYSCDAICQRGRLMLGMNAQGPPGNGHGGSLAAVLDDLIGNCGAQAALQLHLLGTLQSQPLFSHVQDSQKYIAMALNRYAGMTDLERSQIVLPPGLTLATLEANREKVLPYTNSEIAFIVPVLGSVARSSGAPGILVGSLNIQLKRRVPLLSRLAVRARVTSLDGKRIGVTAEIFGKKTTRLTALEKDESGGWEGEWDVLLARGTGTCIVMYDMGLIIGKGTAAPKGGAKM